MKNQNLVVGDLGAPDPPPPPSQNFVATPLRTALILGGQLKGGAEGVLAPTSPPWYIWKTVGPIEHKLGR